MLGLTLKHLRYISALATHQHFGRAADACSITQPALSIQIKELEAMVGAPLVERSKRQIQMTPLGREVVAHAQRILADIDTLGDVVRAARGPMSGRFRLGIIPTIAPYILPDIVHELGAAYPALDLMPKEAITAALLDDLFDHKLDAAVVALPISDQRLFEFSLFAEEFVLVRNRKDADKPIPSADSLKEMKLLLLGEGHCFRDQAISFCDLSDATSQDVMEGSTLTTLVQMVSAGLGVTLIPEMAVPFETRSAEVSIAALPRRGPARTIGLIWRKTNPLKDQLLEMGAVIRRVGRNIQDYP